MNWLHRLWLQATWRGWWCRVTGRHAVVPGIPMCFRCDTDVTNDPRYVR